MGGPKRTNHGRYMISDYFRHEYNAVRLKAFNEIETAMKTENGLEGQLKQLGEGYFRHLDRMTNTHLHDANFNTGIKMFEDRQQRQDYIDYLKVQRLQNLSQHNAALRDTLEQIQDYAQSAFYREHPEAENRLRERIQANRVQLLPLHMQKRWVKDEFDNLPYAKFEETHLENEKMLSDTIKRFGYAKEPVNITEDDLVAPIVVGKAKNTYKTMSEYLQDAQAATDRKIFADTIDEMFKDLPKPNIHDSNEYKAMRKTLTDLQKSLHEKDVNPNFYNTKLQELKTQANEYLAHVGRKGVKGREDRLAFATALTNLPKEYSVKGNEEMRDARTQYNNDKVRKNKIINDFKENLKREKEEAKRSKNKGKGGKGIEM